MLLPIHTDLFDSISQQAKSSPRLRASYDLRIDPHETGQRLLNALEVGTVVPIHRHLDALELVIVLRGKIRLTLFDETGQVTSTHVYQANTDNIGFRIHPNTWHTIVCLSANTILLETKDQPYHPLLEEELWDKPMPSF